MIEQGYPGDIFIGMKNWISKPSLNFNFIQLTFQKGMKPSLEQFGSYNFSSSN